MHFLNIMIEVCMYIVQIIFSRLKFCARKVDLWSFSKSETSEKICKSTFQIKISVWPWLRNFFTHIIYRIFIIKSREISKKLFALGSMLLEI